MVTFITLVHSQSQLYDYAISKKTLFFMDYFVEPTFKIAHSIYYMYNIIGLNSNYGQKLLIIQYITLHTHNDYESNFIYNVTYQYMLLHLPQTQGNSDIQNFQWRQYMQLFADSKQDIQSACTYAWHSYPLSCCIHQYLKEIHYSVIHMAPERDEILVMKGIFDVDCIMLN